MGRSREWDADADAAIKGGLAEKKSARQVARELGLPIASVIRRIAFLRNRGLLKPEPMADHRSPQHIMNYRDARRGFHVPPHLENSYIQLIVGGMSIADARRKLGIHDNGQEPK